MNVYRDSYTDSLLKFRRCDFFFLPHLEAHGRGWRRIKENSMNVYRDLHTDNQNLLKRQKVSFF